MRPLPLAAALLLVSSAQALDLYELSQYKQPNLRHGQLALHPSYRLTETYDSNIYLVPRDVSGGVKGSWITKNDLALEAVLPWRKLHSFSAGCDLDAHLYSEQPRFNNTINQKAHVDYVYEGAYGVTRKLGDQYENTTDQASSELVARERRWRNVIYAELDYNPENGILAGGADASHTVHKYLGAEIGRELNRYEQRASFNIGWKIQPKTKLYASYHRGVTRYTVHRELPDADKNSKSHDAGLGVSGVLAPKITGKVEGGVTHREYDEDPAGGSSRVSRHLTAAAAVVYKPSTGTEITLAASRRLQESTFGVSRFYISSGASLDVKRRLPRKISVGVNAEVGVDKYPDAQTVAGVTGSRRDDRSQGGVWVEYDIQAWLSTGLAYVFLERNSTFSGQFNYRDHRASWNAALKF